MNNKTVTPTLLSFIDADNPKGLFPLTSTVTLIRHGEAAIRDFVYKEIFNDQEKAASFVTFPVAYAMKDKRHLRRCLLLDPIASFYIYDFVWRHRDRFQASEHQARRHFGYAFHKKQPIGSFNEYHEFRRLKYKLKDEFAYFGRVDIANCFNSFYHHDITSFLTTHVTQPEGAQAGQFLREGNSGRSVNCFPQGIYPAKTIGNFFLQFIEGSKELKSDAVIRFLDDIYLFANRQKTIDHDVIVLQQLIGDRGLSLNGAKSVFGSSDSEFDERKLDEIKRELLQKRETVANYDEDEVDDADEVELTNREIDYLKQLIADPNVAEEDVELALSLLKEDDAEAEKLASLVVRKYPNLLRSLYNLTRDIEDNGAIIEELVSRSKRADAQEFELFWIAKILIDHYQWSEEIAEDIIRVFQHQNATPIVRAVILEMAENSHGLLELKEQQLRSQASNLMAISAAVGLIAAEKGKRNQTYKYAAKASRYMKIVCDICHKL